MRCKGRALEQAQIVMISLIDMTVLGEFWPFFLSHPHFSQIYSGQQIQTRKIFAHADPWTKDALFTVNGNEYVSYKKLSRKPVYFNISVLSSQVIFYIDPITVGRGLLCPSPLFVFLRSSKYVARIIKISCDFA